MTIPGLVLTIQRVDEVGVLFIATDKRGRFVRNLSQSDFNFLDDHKPVQSIVNFRRETDLPLKMGLLVDVSGSVHTRFDFEQDAATSFMQHVIRAGFDKVFVMGFNGHQQVSQDFTDNTRLLSQAVHGLRDGGAPRCMTRFITHATISCSRNSRIIRNVGLSSFERRKQPVNTPRPRPSR
jgi:VWFA-related protein